MRTLIAVLVLVLIGCSQDRGASDLTEEQRAALQSIGESLTRDSDSERGWAAMNSLSERELDMHNKVNDGSEDFQTAKRFSQAVASVKGEFEHRSNTEGPKKAADWIIGEARKSDDQLIENWTPKEKN